MYEQDQKRWNPSRSKWYNAVRRARIRVNKVSRARKKKRKAKEFQGRDFNR